LRAVIAFVVLFTIWLGIGVVHAIEEPNLDDPGTLSPTGTGGHGSSRLAHLLAARGVAVDRVMSSEQARQLAQTGADSTIFVPTPDYLDPEFFSRVSATSGVSRVVVVQPGPRTVILAELPLGLGIGRWVTHTVPADCTAPSIAEAGAATVNDSSYSYEPYASDFGFQSLSCYHGSVLGVRTGRIETVYVGANDLFRNDRIGEVGNAPLATALLAGRGRVIWVDVHTTEPTPQQVLAIHLPQYRRADQDRTGTGFPTIDAFPSWLWAGFLLAGACVILLAVARARRLGSPVSEPLPVIVPAAEAVTGRGRLYERIAARESTLDALRTAAIGRMAPVLYPFGTAPPERDLAQGGSGAAEFATRIALRVGMTEAAVLAILYGAPPTTDDQLTLAVASLDVLVGAVLTPRVSPTDPFQGARP
jgi:hypothetical protein